MPSIQDFLLWFVLLGCVLPIFILLIGALFAYWFGKQWLENVVQPDIEAISIKLAEMQKKDPSASRQQLIDKIAREQAIKCGVIGAITGVGGFITLPLSLPIDLILSARYQANMVSFIAQTYGYTNQIENQIATTLVMSGSTQISKFSLQLFQKYAPVIASKTFSKFVPVLGAVLGFIINYTIARSMATAASKWYGSRSKSEILQSAGSM
jgi:hypothetical protein